MRGPSELAPIAVGLLSTLIAVVPSATLASTPDANTSDPFVQEKEAELDYDPQRIFDFLRTDIGYESYEGSLRGARGKRPLVAG